MLYLVDWALRIVIGITENSGISGRIQADLHGATLAYNCCMQLAHNIF